MVGVVVEEERRTANVNDVIFTYGTLKRGFWNHRLMEELISSGDAVFMGSYRTCINYPLVCGPYRVPFLINLPGCGNHRVQGELYSVTAAGLARLDHLEGTSRGHYDRLPIDVEPGIEDEENDNSTIVTKAEAYFAHSSYALKLWNKDGRKGFASYSKEVAHGYVCRNDRPQHLTFLQHILSFLDSESHP